MAMPVVLRSSRLSLRLLNAADLEAVHAIFSSDGHTIGEGPITDSLVTMGWLHRRTRLHKENGLAWYGLWDSDETLVGTCGAFLGRCGDEPEVGYEIAIPWRGRGYAAEALGVVTEAGHSAGHPRLWATIRPANVASLRTVRSRGYLMVRRDPDPKGALDYYAHSGAKDPAARLHEFRAERPSPD